MFRRLTRQQLIARRRSLGLQSLVFEIEPELPRVSFAAKTPPAPLNPVVPPGRPRCHLCGRGFSSVWRALRCHLCGFFVCDACSRVVERERELHRVQYVRCCAPCLTRINAHCQLVDADILAAFAAAPWVAPSKRKSQLQLHLADVLRHNVDLRPAVLTLLRLLGRPIVAPADVLDNITANDWAATTATTTSSMNHTTTITADGTDVSGFGSPDNPGRKISNVALSEMNGADRAQFLVQQCFEVQVPELPLDQCVFAEHDGRRAYTLAFDEATGIASAPLVSNENQRNAAIDASDLLRPDFLTPEMRLVCLLAAKELDCMAASITVVRGDQWFALSLGDDDGYATAERSQACCAYATAWTLPFLIRHTLLDLRFCKFPSVLTGDAYRFYVSFPLLNAAGTLPIAHLTVLDTKPHQSVTTAQYATAQMLAHILTSMCFGASAPSSYPKWQ